MAISLCLGWPKLSDIATQISRLRLFCFNTHVLILLLAVYVHYYILIKQILFAIFIANPTSSSHCYPCLSCRLIEWEFHMKIEVASVSRSCPVQQTSKSFIKDNFNSSVIMGHRS